MSFHCYHPDALHRRGVCAWRATVLAFCLSIGPAIAADAPAAQPGVNSITQAVVNAGALACASRVNQVTNFLSSGSPNGAFLFAPTAPADQRLTSVSMEIANKDAPVAYASASFAPNQANGCGAVYEAVVYWPQSCDVVAAKQFGNTKKGRVLLKSVQALELEGATRIFLMPAGSGCVSIKKEVVL